MDEKTNEQGTEASGAAAPADNQGAGDQPKTLDKVERAEQIVERLEAVEKRIDEKTAKLEDLEAKRILGGKSVGAQTPVAKEETPHDYRMRIEKEMAAGKTEFGN